MPVLNPVVVNCTCLSALSCVSAVVMHIVAFVYEGVKWIIIITKGQNLRCILDSVALSKRYCSNNKEILFTADMSNANRQLIIERYQ